jgi:hypothetical protein
VIGHLEEAVLAARFTPCICPDITVVITMIIDELDPAVRLAEATLNTST